MQSGHSYSSPAMIFLTLPDYHYHFTQSLRLCETGLKLTVFV